jgi:hypothetical protein
MSGFSVGRMAEFSKSPDDFAFGRLAARRVPTMDQMKTTEEVDQHRRRLFGTAAMTVAAAQLGMIGAAHAQADKTKPTQLPTIRPGTNTTFAALKQIDAGLLNVGYAEAGPADGDPVVLLHGWPYDIYS